MVTYSVAFVVATLVALILTPLMRLVALRYRVVSNVGGRNVNDQEIPRLGGIAIGLAVFVPILLLFFVQSGVATIIRTQGLLAAGLGFGALVMMLVGAVDDFRGMRALHKLVLQVACASLAYVAGFQVHAVTLPGLGILEMGAFAFPVTIMWIVGITNAVNLIDGLDGLAAGVVFCAAGTNLVVAVSGGNVFVATVMAATMGALFGFLFFNFNPAKIFMGDSGSYFLGFTVATASLVGSQKSSTAVALLVPVLALGVPIFDTLFSIARRGVQRRPIFSADRGHLHHRLLDMGLTHRRAVLVLYSFSVAFAVIAGIVSLGRDWQMGLAIGAAMVMVTGLVFFVRSFDRLHPFVDADQPLTQALLVRLPPLVLSYDPAFDAERAAKWLSGLGDLPENVHLSARAVEDRTAREGWSKQFPIDEASWVLEVSARRPLARDAVAVVGLFAGVVSAKSLGQGDQHE